MLVVLISLSTVIFAQTPPAVAIRVFGVSPSMIKDSVAGIDRPSNGLPNVAPNTKVYLYCGGKPSTGATGGNAQYFSSATFTLKAIPAGSAAQIMVLDSIRCYFIPDMVGTYRVEMTGTDNKGQSGTDELAINCGNYVGVGGILGTAAVPECSVCHAEKTTEWQGTKHATAMQTKMIQSIITRTTCYPCHATGSTDPLAKGNGWLDVAAALSWTLPGIPGAGSWDSLMTDFPSLAKMGNIQCENCHGPGSEHMGNKTDNKIAVVATSEQCKQCHDAPSHHVKFYQWDQSAHANSYNSSTLENMNRGSSDRNSDCARCHTSNGYLDVFYNSPDPSTAVTKAPYKNVGYVACVTCHDPHSAEHEFQLRKDAKDICEDCHALRVSSSGSLHEAHQGPMLEGTDGREFPGYTYRTSAHKNIPEKCVTCHMAAPPDPSLVNKIGEHSFKIVYNNGTPTDASDDILNTTGCVSCHGAAMSLQQVEETQSGIKAKLEELRLLLPQRSATNTNPKLPSDTTLTQAQQDASFNWYFVNNDGSFGVHNHFYSLDLLNSSIEAVKATAVEPIDNAIPGNYSLGQNYPNPFNPSTEIQFSIPETQSVKLVVFDATGKVMSLLVNGKYQPGTYRTRWLGTNTEGQVVPSGVYFYTIIAGKYSSTKKMVLMK